MNLDNLPENVVKYLKENVINLGCSCEISKTELDLSGNMKEDLIKYKKEVMSKELGLLLLKENLIEISCDNTENPEKMKISFDINVICTKRRDGRAA